MQKIFVRLVPLEFMGIDREFWKHRSNYVPDGETKDND